MDNKRPSFQLCITGCPPPLGLNSADSTDLYNNSRFSQNMLHVKKSLHLQSTF